MNFNNLFIIIDNMLGDIATFKGLSFEFDHGMLVIDYFDLGLKDNFTFICEFHNYDTDSVEYFAAVDLEELREQFEHYVLL